MDIGRFPVVILLVHFSDLRSDIVSFAGLGFLALFIAGRLNVLDTRGAVWKTILALTPLVGAGMIAISRLMDNRYPLPFSRPSPVSNSNVVVTTPST